VVQGKEMLSPKTEVEKEMLKRVCTHNSLLCSSEAAAAKSF
jgi:hypothetical protein